ncbi:hypothetical protein H0H92_011498 [Tricholoma furcatifolium]|nr:hypothetical protein H0H92_011498 [Tricholoma furcatifolium]
MDLRELTALGATSKTFRGLVTEHIQQNVHNLFISLDLEPISFLALLRDTNSIVTGSVALLAIHPRAFKPGDIDISPLTELQVDITQDEYDIGEESHIDEVLTLYYGGRKANVIVSATDSVLRPLFRFHSTAVMNCITSSSIFCAYPTFTISLRSLVNKKLERYYESRLVGTMDNFNRALDKYKDRGFSYPDASANVQNAYLCRRFADDQKCMWVKFGEGKAKHFLIRMSAPIQDVIMLFGDSITQGAWTPGLLGFGEQLSHVYARKLDVLNRGLSGYNTEWATPVLKRTLAPKGDKENVPKIRLLTIWFGANDACIKPSPQHVPVDKFAANLRDWVDLVHSPTSEYYSPQTRIILISPPPVNTYQRRADLESREEPRSLDREFGTTRQYAEAVKNVAREKNVAFTDVWTALWEAADKDEQSLSKFLYDGLHLNAEGYQVRSLAIFSLVLSINTFPTRQVLYRALVATIKESYPEVHFENLSETFPPWLTLAEQSAQN